MFLFNLDKTAVLGSARLRGLSEPTMGAEPAPTRLQANRRSRQRFNRTLREAKTAEERGTCRFGSSSAAPRRRSSCLATEARRSPMPLPRHLPWSRTPSIAPPGRRIG